MSIELLKKVHAELPHVRTIWVNENGDYYLVAISDCTMFTLDGNDDTTLIETTSQDETDELTQDETAKPRKRK